ncbi:uncharacterized protein LOC113859689 [Abrus precatorius]|uniref:Uncharacterized protein LOC113859689 n=1 Tax=Abrus precatorius TaxID=3816 RepID=A0A8B8KWF0_ABRPR|nr:uncharacterized protein LOC113859689 [Abrus precatorius]
MGCCFSTPKTQNQNQIPNQKHQNALKIQQPHEPPPYLEEESVKEVLSETPIPKSLQVPILMPETKTQMPSLQNPPVKFETKVPIPIEDQVSEVVSQLSETCSISESFSTATTTTATTTTATEKREEDEATSKRSRREGATNHKWDRSPSRKRPYVADGNFATGRERRVKSPARRPDPSPEKKIKGGSRVVRGRGSGPVANRKLNAGSAAVRRDPGEGSGRRSRSPSCARAVGGTSKVGAGGGRKQVLPENGVVEKEKEKEKEKSESEEVVEKNDVVSPEECLENPHVSMECFIFL